MKDYKIYDVELDELDAMQGIQFISFVKDPAMQSNFIALSEAKIELAVQKDKQYVTGAVLIPNKVIPRLGNKALRFSSDSIEKCRNHFHKLGSLNQTNIEHSEHLINTTIIESWIKQSDTDNREIALGFSPMPVGTWFATYHVPCTTDWNDFIISKQCEGFSIEGMLSQIEAKLSTEATTVINNITNPTIEDEIKTLLHKIQSNLN